MAVQILFDETYHLQIAVTAGGIEGHQPLEHLNGRVDGTTHSLAPKINGLLAQVRLETIAPIVSANAAETIP